MPPRIIEEMMTFLDINDQHVKDFLNVITPKSPNVTDVSFPASVFFKLVEEIRDRSYKGLRIAEESVEAGAQKVMGKTAVPRIEYQKTIGEVVTKLRERYRQATRFNFLDSVADLDLIVLSKELDAFLVTSDEGVIRWGRTFGIKEVGAPLLLSRLLGLLG
jgi:RNA ligase partner protein